MKPIPLALEYFLAVLCVVIGTTAAQAQTAHLAGDVPRTISYQGQLTGPDNLPVIDGGYRITLALYADENGVDKLWEDSYLTEVRGGIFNLHLGSGTTPLPDAATMNRPLWIGMQLENSAPMRPLTPLSASPYALNVPDGAISSDKLANGAVTAGKVDMEYVSAIAVNGETVTAKGTILNIEADGEIGLAYDRQTNTIRIGNPSAAARGDREKGAQAQSTPDAWNSQGDLTDGVAQIPTVAGDWIGTSANPLNGTFDFEMRVNNERVMLYQPNGTNTPNIVGGSGSNTISAASSGSVIAGGGTAGSINQITNDAEYAVISGGTGNTVSNDYAAVGGGRSHAASGINSTIAGGVGNTASGASSSIGGGDTNTASGTNSTVSGGERNVAGGNFSTVGGGLRNTASNLYNTVGGGYQNSITASYSTISGGYNNAVTGGWAVIGGGDENLASATNATIAGGWDQTASGNFSTIGGGRKNRAAGVCSAIPGGDSLNTTGYAQAATGFWNAPRGTLTVRPTAAAILTNNDPLFMVGNGVSDGPRSNAFEVSYNGHTTVYGVNGTVNNPIKGATYADNILYAWGDITAVGGINNEFGVVAVNHPAAGIYEITIAINDPVTGVPLMLGANAPVAITATLIADPGDPFDCGDIRVSRMGVPAVNQFTVYTIGTPVNGDCDAEDSSFMFHMTARP